MNIFNFVLPNSWLSGYVVELVVSGPWTHSGASSNPNKCKNVRTSWQFTSRILVHFVSRRYGTNIAVKRGLKKKSLIFTEKRTRGRKKGHVQKYFKLRRLKKKRVFSLLAKNAKLDM